LSPTFYNIYEWDGNGASAIDNHWEPFYTSSKKLICGGKSTKGGPYGDSKWDNAGMDGLYVKWCHADDCRATITYNNIPDQLYYISDENNAESDWITNPAIN
jgi:hypothetical protein